MSEYFHIACTDCDKTIVFNSKQANIHPYTDSKHNEQLKFNFVSCYNSNQSYPDRSPNYND